MFVCLFHSGHGLVDLSGYWLEVDVSDRVYNLGFSLELVLTVLGSCRGCRFFAGDKSRRCPMAISKNS